MGEPSEYEKEKGWPSSRTLHNFTLPTPLKWSQRRQLRCIKPTSCNDRRSSGGSDGGGEGGSKPRAAPPRPPRRSSGGPREQMKGKGYMIQDACGAAATTTTTISGGCREIAEIRQKLTTDFQAEAKLMKQSFLDGNEKKKSSEEELNGSRPWNLRTRKGGGGGSNGGGSAGLSPESMLRKSADEEVVREGSSGSGLQNSKFSLTLTREEIEADFLAITGAKPPRRPKRRPRAVKKYIDAVFPGSWLSEVTPDTYKVPENGDQSKK